MTSRMLADQISHRVAELFRNKGAQQLTRRKHRATLGLTACRRPSCIFLSTRACCSWLLPDCPRLPLELPWARPLLGCTMVCGCQSTVMLQDTGRNLLCFTIRTKSDGLAKSPQCHTARMQN